MKPYTVLLLWPDYAAETYGQATSLIHTEARGPRHAITKSQMRVFNPSVDIDHKPYDWYPLAVFEGHLKDVKPCPNYKTPSLAPCFCK